MSFRSLHLCLYNHNCTCILQHRNQCSILVCCNCICGTTSICKQGSQNQERTPVDPSFTLYNNYNSSIPDIRSRSKQHSKDTYNMYRNKLHMIYHSFGAWLSQDTNHRNLQGVCPWWKCWAQCVVSRFLQELSASQLHLLHDSHTLCH
jgi:hypothetical protein